MKVLLTLLLLAAMAIAQESAVRSLGDGFETKTRSAAEGEIVLVKFPGKYLGDAKHYVDGLKIAVRRAANCKDPKVDGGQDSHSQQVFNVKCSNQLPLLVYPMYESDQSDKLLGAAFLKLPVS